MGSIWRSHGAGCVGVCLNRCQHFGEHGIVNHADSLYEQLLRVPIVISDTPGWKLRDGVPITGHIDLAPTILALTGTAIPNRMQGVPLLVPVTNHLPEVKRPNFASVQSILSADAAIDWPYKIIRDANLGKIEIYDLENNPGELPSLPIGADAPKDSLIERFNTYRGEQLWIFAQSKEHRTGCVPPQFHRKQNR